MASHMRIGFFGEIRPRVDPGHGENRSIRCPFSRGLCLEG